MHILYLVRGDVVNVLDKGPNCATMGNNQNSISLLPHRKI